MTLQLVVPQLKYESSYRAYIEELGREIRYPHPLDLEFSCFQSLLRRLEDFTRGVDLPIGMVPNTTFWLVQNDELLGVSNLRHYLNDSIRHLGGHIGLGIRPSQRGRGLGNNLLRLTAAQARKRSITPIHVHCHKHNAPSARMILSNGGLLESEFRANLNETIQRYLIYASPSLISDTQ